MIRKSRSCCKRGNNLNRVSQCVSVFVCYLIRAEVNHGSALYHCAKCISDLEKVEVLRSEYLATSDPLFVGMSVLHTFEDSIEDGSNNVSQSSLSHLQRIRRKQRRIGISGQFGSCRKAVSNIASERRRVLKVLRISCNSEAQAVLSAL